MKLQVSLVPELIMDALLLITVISFTFGTIVLHSQFKISISEKTNREEINLAEAIRGDKCILAEIEGTKIKGIFDYERIKNKEFCVKGNFSIIFDEEISFGKGCKNSLYVFPVLIKKNDDLVMAKLLACYP
jgi:hypothetical protein